MTYDLDRLQATLDELQRLHRDFDNQASRYSDLTLTIYMVMPDAAQTNVTLRQPNRAIPLWQFMGNIATADDVEQITRRIAAPTDYGVAGALLSVFAILEGVDAPLFRRMAYRAGSVIPAELREEVVHRLTQTAVQHDAIGKPVFVNNSNHLAVWLKVVLDRVAAVYPERLRDATIAVDPFAASLPACDFVMNWLTTPRDVSRDGRGGGLADKMFDVALSFPGERRDFVSAVARGLRAAQVDVFYDAFFEADIAQPNLDVLLQKIYHSNSKLNVVFVCEEYERKEWCGLEWRALRDLIKRGADRSVMLMRFDDAPVGGLFSIDGYIDLRNRTPEQAVQLIQARLVTL